MVFAGVVTVRPDVFSSIGSRRDTDDFAFRVSVAEERADVLAHFGEGVAAEVPGLVEVRPISAAAPRAYAPSKVSG
jgi:hypothetical protein